MLVSVNCFATQVTLKSFGAVGDGITDDFKSISKASLSLKDYDTLIFEANKNYLVSDKILIGVSCILIGNDATITPTDSFMRRGGICLSVGKGLSNAAVTGLVAIKGASDITLPTTITVKVGDIIQFLSPDVLYAFRPELASYDYHRGQYGVVTNVGDNNKITISTPFFDSLNVNSIAVFKSCNGIKVSGLKFDLTKQPDTKNPVIALAIKATNSTLENCTFTGNEFGFCAVQIDGENSIVTGCTIKDFFNIQGFAGGRLGYGINAACNNILVTKNTITNCKHCFTTAARKFVVCKIKVFQNTFSEDTLKAISQIGSVNPKFDYAGTVDIHSGVADAIIISENTIHSQGRAFFIRNGRAAILNNKVFQNGNPVGLIGLEERPIESLLIENNTIELSSTGSPYILGKYLSLATDPGYIKNVVISQNTITNGSLFVNSVCKFNIDGLLVENNILNNCKVMDLTKSDSSVIFNNIKVQNNTSH